MATEENGNYSKIPNAFIHNLISANLSASEIEIALYVARLTFGFHEESKIISLTSFQKATSHTRWTVWNSIESLVRKCVLVRKSIPSGSEYRINKEFASTEMRTSTEKHTRASTENPTQVVRKSVPVKERLKETIKEKKKDPSKSNGALESFNLFWQAYPKKEAKKGALSCWVKLNPSPDLLEEILKKIDQFKETPQWKKDNGQFIPLPTTWLNGKRWEDEGVAVKDWREF